MRKKGFGRGVVILSGIVLAALIGVRIWATEMEDKVFQIDEDQPYRYGSRCQFAYSLLDDDLDEQWSGWNAPEVWNLMEIGTDGAEIAAYLLTAEPVDPGNMAKFYRAMPLESDRESRLQVILLRSFPYLPTEELEKEVNSIKGEGTLIDLTVGEVISAAQQAIWKVSYGEQMVSRKLYVSIRGMGEYDQEQFRHPGSLDESLEQSTTANNIRNLYHFYLELVESEQVMMKEVTENVEMLCLEPVGEGPVFIGLRLNEEKIPEGKILRIHTWNPEPDAPVVKGAFCLMLIGLGMVVIGILLSVRCLIWIGRE